MTGELASFDLKDAPELARLAREVRSSKRPVRLTDGGETVAVLVPNPKPRRRTRAATAEDDAAFLASAGGWKDLDLEQFERDNAESRRISTRSAPDL